MLKQIIIFLFFLSQGWCCTYSTKSPNDITLSSLVTTINLYIKDNSGLPDSFDDMRTDLRYKDMISYIISLHTSNENIYFPLKHKVKFNAGGDEVMVVAILANLQQVTSNNEDPFKCILYRNRTNSVFVHSLKLDRMEKMLSDNGGMKIQNLLSSPVIRGTAEELNHEKSLIRSLDQSVLGIQNENSEAKSNDQKIKTSIISRKPYFLYMALFLVLGIATFFIFRKKYR